MDPASAIDSYSVDSTISFSLEGLSGNSSTNIYGIKWSDTSGKLQVDGKIDITGAGWIPLAEEASDRSNTAVSVTGIHSGSSNEIESSAIINMIATGGTATASAFASASATGILRGAGAVTNSVILQLQQQVALPLALVMPIPLLLEF